ncbi:MAG: hypothetical protein JW712_08015 [Dehalococcoidales bacterium]|nr:hypothetical protein [Dehalococcoidales bacterium]
MSVKRRDLIRYLEDNGFLSSGKEADTQYILMQRKRYPKKDTGLSIELLLTNCVNKQEFTPGSNYMKQSIISEEG